MKGICQKSDCSTIAIWGYPDDKNGSCGEHKTDDMIITFDNDDFQNLPWFDDEKPEEICKFRDCCENGNYNFPGEINGRFCDEHKLETMVNLSQKLGGSEIVYMIEQISSLNLMDSEVTSVLTPFMNDLPTNLQTKHGFEDGSFTGPIDLANFRQDIFDTLIPVTSRDRGVNYDISKIESLIVNHRNTVFLDDRPPFLSREIDDKPGKSEKICEISDCGNPAKWGYAMPSRCTQHKLSAMHGNFGWKQYA